jgi:DNA-directed RNA polymerase sigma subunit (sigma70/sigma32)
MPNYYSAPVNNSNNNNMISNDYNIMTSRRKPNNDIVSLPNHSPNHSQSVSLGKRSRMVRPRGRNSSPRLDSLGDQREDLLSQDEERNLTHNIRSLRRAVRIRDDLVNTHNNHESSTTTIPTEAEWGASCNLSVMGLRRVMYEGQQARTVLVSANAGLVTSIAKRHYLSLKQATEAGGGVGTILTLQDMIQEGNLGLMQAAERFEPERGLRFSTYATYWIKQRILRSISDSSRIIRLPAHGTLSFVFFSLSEYLSRKMTLTSVSLFRLLKL